ncbi:hypothetical protein ABZP36_023653 [Zizania latifolia]
MQIWKKSCFPDRFQAPLPSLLPSIGKLQISEAACRVGGNALSRVMWPHEVRAILRNLSAPARPTRHSRKKSRGNVSGGEVQKLLSPASNFLGYFGRRGYWMVLVPAI